MKNINVESQADMNDDIVMEMADQLRNEGFHEGFSQGIRYGLKTAITLKFAERSNELLDMLNQISDVDKLTRINEAIVFIEDENRLRELMS